MPVRPQENRTAAELALNCDRKPIKPVMRINKDLRNLTGYEGELLISGRAKARAHSFLSSSFKKYMYEADEGPIEPPLQPKGPVVDQAGHITGTTMQQTTGMPPAKELERVQPGAQVPPGNIPPPKGPERTFREDGPMDEKMEKEAEKAEEDLEGELDAIAEEDLEGLEGNDVEGDKEARAGGNKIGMQTDDSNDKSNELHAQ
ncbi:unnamed protein product [Cladocopium goreaui]|uniref:50S ribosomal protein L3 n=1 Tax=Cladocopium goreaui TaxID=2562237 RepID=A0A9P1G7E9_9DINO|nr:unnamed protein product [Cladocopium goreaui]